MLPPVRRRRRRDWGRILARILCVVFALAGLIPASIGVLVQTPWARGIATRETRKIVAGLGIDASYELELQLWPLSVTLRDIRVASSDGGAPFLTAKRATARPKIFGLLAGKVTIDEIEIEEPKARVVMKDGKLQNLHLDLPESKDTGPMKRPPFSVISASGADVDIEVDGIRGQGHEIDVDVSTDDDGEGGTAFEVAIRMAEARGRLVRKLKEGGEAVDDDLLCRLDGRARIEPSRILVRRLSAFGAVDFDPADAAAIECTLPKSDKRYVELAFGHFAVGLPKKKGDLPTLDGHAKLRAPLAVMNRFPGTPDVDGWVSVDTEMHYSPETPIPDMTGRLEAAGIRLDHFSFARSIKSEFAVKRSIVTSPLTRVEIADGVADIRDVEVQPLAKGLPLKATLDAHDVSFASLMIDLGVARTPHVTWDLREVHATAIHGTLDPLKLDGDLFAHTTNFAVYDAPISSDAKTRAIGVALADIRGKLAIRPSALEFHNTTVTTSHSVITGVLVSLGFHEVLRVEVPDAKVALEDVSPIGSVAMGGFAQAKATIIGPFGDPKIEGDVSIQNYTLGDKPNELGFGNVTQGHILVEHLDQKAVSLVDVRAQKGKSTYELPTGRLEFGGAASMRMDGQVTSKNLDIRDFFSVFKLEEDPRFLELEGVLETSARVHLALGGPEDPCKGGYVEVSASTNMHNLNLLGERFDEGHADFDYRWFDRQAGIEGAEVDVRSLSLAKVKKEGKAAIGSLLGSVFVKRGGELRGSLVMQGFPLSRTDMLGKAAANIEGSASGVARVSGTVSAYAVDADVNVTPVRIGGVPFGGSDVHVSLVQNPKTPKIVGKTACGAPISAPFDKEAYLRDTSVQGAITASGALFGGQVKLDEVVMTRQKAPVVSGKLELARFDLGPIGKILVKESEEEGVTPSPIGGEISGDIVLEHIATNDFPHAKASFTPKAMRVTRAGQRLEWKPAPVAFTLEDDTVTIPRSTFELATPNGLKGAFSLNGSVRKITRNAELALDAELSPIDLGILVGVVPRVTRARGTLSGSVRLGGSASSPQFDGQLKIKGGEFGIKGLPSDLSEVDVDLTADESEARITRATGKFLGGDVSLTARMPLKGGQLGVAEATLIGRQLYLSPIEGVKATVDADLEVTVNPNATTATGRLPFVGGEVTITSFEATKPFTLNLTDFRGGSKRTVVETYDPTLDAVNLGFDIRSRAPLRIRNNLVEAQLAIDPRGIHVSGTNQRMGLRGELNTLPGGRFRVFANDFDIQKATIRFDDPTRIVPHVDVIAVTEYRRYSNTLTGAGANPTAGAPTAGNISSGGTGGSLWRITLHAYGDLEELSIDMTSDPALTREDIFFLLTIGLTRAEVDQVRAGSVYASAAFETIGTISGVDRAVKQAIPVIDDFRPGTAYSPRTGRVEPNITVGRRLGENVRARVTSGLAEDPQLRSSIEWRLNRSLTVEPSYDRINTVSFTNVGNFGIDFRWRLEFN